MSDNSSCDSLPEWVHVWRTGIAPALHRRQLAALKVALEQDDPRLVQGRTLLPSLGEPTAAVRAACALAFCAWQAIAGRPSVADVDREFNRLCHAAGELCGGPAGISIFLDWFDETPRPQMRQHLLAEVELALNSLPLTPTL